MLDYGPNQDVHVHHPGYFLLAPAYWTEAGIPNRNRYRQNRLRQRRAGDLAGTTDAVDWNGCELSLYTEWNSAAMASVSLGLARRMLISIVTLLTLHAGENRSASSSSRFVLFATCSELLSDATPQSI